MNWWEDRANLVVLTAHLAEHGEDAKTVAYAVEKPWKYREEFMDAIKELDEDE